MTDREIKALEDLLELMLHEGDMQRTSIISKALDLLNRQQAEIERLNTVTQADAKIMEKLHEVAGLGFPVCKDARDLIIRISAQADYWQSEYEHLKLDRSMLEGHRYSFHDGKLTMIPKTEEKIIKDRAIKEFADKLDTYIMWHFPIDDPFVADIRLKIDKLVKEMVGEIDDKEQSNSND